jgi:glycogen debranching enzyme
MLTRLQGWSSHVKHAVASTDPTARSYDPIRYWRGPVWVLVNWLVADGMLHTGMEAEAESLRVETRSLVEQGFTEYYDPRNGTGIGGQGFSWSAALTLHWLTASGR